MANLETHLLMGILRAAGLTQDDVVNVMKCGKALVVEADRWFCQCPQPDLEALVQEARIRRVVAERAPPLLLNPEEYVQVAQVTADAIFLHYGRVPGVKAGVPDVAGQNNIAGPVYSRLLKQHWRKLSQLAVTIQRQLMPPGIEVFVSADTCLRLRRAIEAGTVLVHGKSWQKILPVPFEFRPSARSRGRKLEVRMAAELDPLFPHLTAHLGFEFSFDTELDDWKKQMGHIAGICLQIAGKVTQAGPAGLGMDYQGRSRPTGLTYQTPAYICHFILENPAYDALPALEVEVERDRLWKLRPIESQATTLATGTEAHIRRCRDGLLEEVRREREFKVWPEIRRGLAGIKDNGEHLQELLSPIIARGYFQGTCPICRGYFDGTASTSSPVAGG